MNLKSSYQREDFLKFLNDFLPSFQRDIRAANSAGSHSLTKSHYLGRCPELDLEVYEFAHEGSGNKRVGLTRDGFRVMKNHAAYRALAVFYSEDTKDWRLSLMTASPDINPKGQVDLSFSNPRRYSFFLGPQARVNTPKKYLFNQGKVKDLNDLLQRFNVEVVTKEFFSNYRKLYENLSTYLEKDRAFQAVASESEFGTDNFAKKLLGQIVFLYFVQRKGWLGAKAEDSVTRGDQNFMRNLYNRCVEENKNFFNDFLEPLFYDALNKRPERAGSFYRELFQGQIPFLNGGLFEPLQNYDWKNAFLHIPNEIFSTNPSNPEQGDGILDIFDLYNFTVDESDAVDQEVSVDPEMLGKVFENLLPENLRKGKGTYYTPREIVHYMCHESLIKHLANDTNIEEKKIRDLANLYETPLVEGEFRTAAYWEGEKDEIISSLSSIRIVDPACGSGAFLIGMLQEIVKLNHILGPKVDDYQLRRKIIENNLYGVDIDPGAVEIAKLRLWLALVVDYELLVIEPLPNLDYKIMQGNSLIEEFEGVNFYQDIETENANPLIDFGKERRMKVAELKKKKREYFSAVNSEKRAIKSEIEQLTEWLVKDSLEVKREELVHERNLVNHHLNQLSPLKHAEFWKKATAGLVTNLRINDLLHKIVDPRSEKPFFLWRLYFVEVFEEKGGFDVVIANPPYIDSEGMVKQGLTGQREAIQSTYSWTKGNWDIYIAFFEQGFRLLSNNGVLTFITPDKWISKPFGNEFRIGTINNIYLLIKAGRKVFESAKVDSIISFYTAKKTGFINVLEYLNNQFLEKRRVVKSGLNSPYVLDHLFSENLDLISKLEKLPKKLADFAICENACATSDAYLLKPMVKDLEEAHPDSNKYFKLINTGTVSKYVSRWGEKLMTYLGDKYLRPVVEKDKFLSTFKNSYGKKALKKKIIIKGLNLLDGCLDETGNIIPGKTTLIIPSDNLTTLKPLLAIVNSKLAQFYIREKYSSSSYNQGIGFTKDMINNLPAPEGNLQNELSVLVDKIIDLTHNDRLELDKLTKVHEYEKQIDQLVYKLYGLTPDEIKVVEAN